MRSHATLLKIRQHAVEERQRMLAAARRREDELRQRMAFYDAELDDEQNRLENATGTALEGRDFAPFVMSRLRAKQELEAQLEAAAQKSIEASERLREAFFDLKTLEITERRARRQAQQEAERKQQQEADDHYGRRRRGSSG